MTINHSCIPLNSPAAWKEALEGIKHTFGHTWENCYAMHLTTGLRTFLYCFEQENIRIVCPIAEREYGSYLDVVKPYGFSGFVGNGTSADFPYYWDEFAKKRGYVCGYLGFNPIFDYSDHFATDSIYEYETVHILKLEPSVDDLLANMAKSRRKHLHSQEKNGIEFVTDKAPLIDFILTNYIDFLIRKSAADAYFFTHQTLSFLLNLENALLVGVAEAGKIIAAAVTFYTDDVADGSISVALPGVKNCAAGLYWHTAKQLKSLNIPILNFGGSGSRDTGIAEFKRQFGCEELPLRCLKQVHNPEIYEMLCKQAQVDSGDMDGYFPAYRRQPLSA